MRIDILTLFPEQIEAVLGASVIGKARKGGLIDVCAHNIRDYTPDKHRRTDDYPYGGGAGMVMQCEPICRCLEAVTDGRRVHTILMSPRGAVFTQQKARELLALGHVALICGHYEGVDQRVIDACVDEELSIGDFVLTGGELAAMAVADAVCRMAPGVLAESIGFEEESHFSGLLEYPHYTRPEVWRGRPVPGVLLSGHHAEIEKWRRAQSLALTRERRPDMLAKLELTPADRALLDGQQTSPAGI